MSTPEQQVVDVVSQQQHTKVVSEAGEEEFVVEFSEDVGRFAPPQIVQPLQPIAVQEGMMSINFWHYDTA